MDPDANDPKPDMEFNEIGDRTILFVGMKQYMDGPRILLDHDFFFKFFNRFVKVESVDIRYRDQYTLIQFRDAKVAYDLHKKGQLRIGDVGFKIKLLNQFDQSKGDIIQQVDNLTFQDENEEVNAINPESIVPTEESPDNLMNALDDECLCLIFERIHLIADFISIANVCWRFKRTAERTLRFKLKKMRVRFVDLTIKGEVSLLKIEDFLRDFGSSISFLELNWVYIKHIPDASNTLLKMINKFCKNVQVFHMYYIFDIKNQTLIEIRPFFSKLKCLAIVSPYSSISMDLNSLISTCNQLTVLGMYYGTYHFILPSINFPNLTTIYIESSDMIAYDTLLEQNPQIEYLRCSFTENICRTIANMPAIRYLILENAHMLTDNDIAYLGSIEDLRVELKNTSLNDTIRKIYPMKNLVSLELRATSVFDENLLIDLIKNLNNLQELKITSRCEELPISKDLLKQMISYANNLSQFNIMFCKDNGMYNYDSRDYNEILNVVQHRTNSIKLSIDISCRKLIFDEYKNDFKILRLDLVPNWLFIQVTYYNS